MQLVANAPVLGIKRRDPVESDENSHGQSRDGPAPISFWIEFEHHHFLLLVCALFVFIRERTAALGRIGLRGRVAKAFHESFASLADVSLQQLARALAVAAFDGVENCPVFGV